MSLEIESAVQRLRDALASYVDRLGNIGAMATIRVPGCGPIQLVAGHADRERTLPLRADHAYQIGSQTKIFTVLAVLVLERAGQLRLTDSVSRYLDFPLDPAITLEMLAMNTSGLGEYADLVLNPSFPGSVYLPPEALVRLCLCKGQGFPPGSHFDYSNVGFVILGLVIERVSGSSLPVFVRRYVLTPLALAGVVFGAIESQPHEQMARGYLVSRTSHGPIDMSRVNLSWAFGTGDMVSTMSTLIDFGQSLLNRDNPLGIHLDDLTLRTACAPRAPTNSPLSLGVEYGYGVERCWWAGRSVWGHRGGTAGYNSGTWIDPECGLIVTTCVTTVRDFNEPDSFATIRYPGPQLFTLALATAYSILAT